MAVHIGDTLKGRYKIVDSLGRGGMADVYKVWDEQRSTYLALKLLRDDLAQDPVFMRRFKREAQNLAGLQHPNIVRFYGLEVDDLKAFILMEYIEGTTLREEILRAGAGGLELGRVQQVMGDVCSALQYAHNKGLVHCDIKSGNILVDASGKAYLTDFGIARGMDAATSTMVGVGTPAYMAPELIRGEDPTPQTDIYALGIVLYEMLTGGERPFTGERATITGTTAEKVRWEHLQLEALPVTDFNPKADPDWNAIIQRCLKKDPNERYTGILVFIDSITKLTKKDLNNLQDTSEDIGKYQEIEPGRKEKNIPIYDEQKDNRGVNRTQLIAGILLLGAGILILLGNYRNSSQKREIIEIKPTNVQSTSDLKHATLPTSTFQSQIYKNDFNGTENWECIYQVKQGDLIANIYNQFGLTFSQEEKFLTNYGECKFDGDNSICTNKQLLEDPDSLQAGSWLVIDGDEKNSTAFNQESCEYKGGYIHLISEKGKMQELDSPKEFGSSDEIIKTSISTSDQMKMVYIPAGSFNTSSYPNPNQSIWLDSFWIDQTEVTNGQYRLCVDVGNCSEPEGEKVQEIDDYFHNTLYDNYPVVNVTMQQAKDFCSWAGRRLPLSLEWEKAARGLDSRVFPWGDILPNYELANFNYLYGGILSVGSFPKGASPYGVLDLSGNVSEWVEPQNFQKRSDWDFGYLRGGSCISPQHFLRINEFTVEDAIRSSQNVGFRCVISDEQ